ncbi:MAG: MerR family transcriptional regulator [Clostridia bacterium]
MRFYEKKGLIGPIQRTKSGIRNYSEQDLKRIEFIKCMREADLPIDVLKKYVDLFEQGNKTINERRLLLENQRTILKEKNK